MDWRSILSLLLVASSWGQTIEPPAGQAGLVAVELPSLERVEPAVKSQIESAVASVSAVTSGGAASEAAMANAYGELGRILHAYELHSAAEAAYSNATALAPDQFGWKHLEAHAQRQAGRLERAAATFREAAELNPQYAAARIWLADVELQRGRATQASSALDQLRESAAVRELRGRVAVAAGRFGDAAAHFERALELAPQANRLHYSIGMAYRELGDVEQARAHLAKRGSVGVRPRDPILEELESLPKGERSHLLLGRLAYQAGSFPSAVAAFRRALDVAPESAEAHASLAAALAAAGDIDAAVRHFRQALELDPSRRDAHFNLGVLAYRGARFAEAAEHFEALLALAPDDREARRQLARSYRRSGRLPKAISELERIHSTAPPNPETPVELAAALVEAQRYREAHELLQGSHRRFPSHLGTVAALARLLAACPERGLRDGPRAVELAEIAHAASPTVLSAETLALAFAEARRCDRAIELQRQVVEIARQSDLPGLNRYQSSLTSYESTNCENGAVF